MARENPPAKIKNALGEFDDRMTYTHRRVGKILGVDERWVKERMLFPSDRDGRMLDGVKYRKAGAIYFITGKAIREWVESNQVQGKPPSDGRANAS